MMKRTVKVTLKIVTGIVVAIPILYGILFLIALFIGPELVENEEIDEDDDFDMVYEDYILEHNN